MNRKSFGKHLKLARNKKDMSAEELGRLVNIDKRSVWQIESGRKGTTLSVMVEMCNALDVNPEYFLSMDINKKFRNLGNNHYELYNKIFDLSPADFEKVKKIIHITIENRNNYN